MGFATRLDLNGIMRIKYLLLSRLYLAFCDFQNLCLEIFKICSRNWSVCMDIDFFLSDSYNLLGSKCGLIFVRCTDLIIYDKYFVWFPVWLCLFCLPLGFVYSTMKTSIFVSCRQDHLREEASDWRV